MSNFLIEAPRLTTEDLDKTYCDQDAEILEEFENEWIQFLRKNPEKLRGRQEKKINKLRKKKEEILDKQKKVEEELKLQLEFFDESRQELEENFQRTMKEEQENQKEMRDVLDGEVHTAAVAAHNFTLTLPWEKFFYNLERLASREGIPPVPSGLTTDSGRQALVPSTKAQLLLKKEDDDTKPDLHFALHAYQMDEALMKAQSKMYELEIERYQKTIENLEVTSKFLHEHNVWTILKKGDDDTTVASKAPSTVTRVGY
ncbi:unnamed protein product [Cylindrotheca closterium]|uniref:Uncharacterized protein n=1 Tax=Cylindrotheca closterium TaxID=2856 RepID=A0AAD2FP56_9STRA|nr:unnamed protein product [Cylindrotheca closterium]